MYRRNVRKTKPIVRLKKYEIPEDSDDGETFEKWLVTRRGVGRAAAHLHDIRKSGEKIEQHVYRDHTFWSSRPNERVDEIGKCSLCNERDGKIGL